MVGMIAFATALEAAYLENVPQTLVQPDGSTVQCFASGDEYYHWLHDADGFVIVQHPATGFFSYADKVEGELIATDCLPERCEPAGFGLAPDLKPDPVELRRRFAVMAEPQPELMPRPEGAPTFTLINNLVIFVRFSDENEFPTPLATYVGMHNSSSGSSMYNYFREASYDQTTVSSSFYPATSGPAVVSYRDSRPRAYFQPYNATTNPQGYSDDDQLRMREHTLVKAAVDAISSQVSGSLNLDSNGDGLVDNVTVIVRGGPDGWSDLLWPHRWVLYSVTATINGKRVYSYNFQLETALEVGVLCHEMGHTMGAPDFYHYDTCSSNTALKPVWRWDLMAHGLNPPQHSGAYVKKKYFGWLNTIPEITSSGTYTLNPITSSTNNAFKIASPNSSNEYFVVEYRRKTGTFESSLPGSGLLVYRIYPDANPSHPGNRCGPPDEVYIYRPGGTTTVNGDPNSAPYSSVVGRTAINDSTNPSSFLSDGTPGGLNIANVSSAGSTISFTVTLGGGGACTYSITPNSATAPAGGGSGTVTVTTQAGCNWSARSNAAWITVTGGSSGSGNGTIGYSVGANSGGARTGTISIAGRTFTVDQAGAGGGCIYSITPNSATAPAGGGSGTVTVTTQAGCTWTAASNAGWITVTGGSSGSGNGTVSYSVAANSGGARTGTISIAGQTFRVEQAGQGGGPRIGDSYAASYLIPASAHTAGTGGTRWMSDVVLQNLGVSTANAHVFLMRGGQDNSDAVGAPVSVDSGRSLRLADIVASTFGENSVSGALYIGSDRPLLVTSRTFNNAADGTYGQYIEGYPIAKAIGVGQQGRLIQLTENSKFRTNIGFANVSGSTLSVSVDVFHHIGGFMGTKTYSIPPYGYFQENNMIGLLAGGNDVHDAYAIVRSTVPGARYFAYASVVDNRTGDPICVVPAEVATAGPSPFSNQAWWRSSEGDRSRGNRDPLPPSSSISLTLWSPQYGSNGMVTINGVVGTSNGYITGLDWVWDDGTIVSGWFPGTHQYAYNGTYTVTVTAHSSAGESETRSITVSISNAATSPISMTLYAPQYGSDGAVTINGVTGTTTGTIARIDWAWGDGSTDQRGFPATHRYAANGTYVVTVTSRSSLGQALSRNKLVAVWNAATGPDLYLPSAAHLSGAGGTNWRTDLEVHNPGATQATFTVALLKRDQTNARPITRSFWLNPGQSARYADVLMSMFSFSGAGTLRVTPTSGAIAATQRTFNDQPSGTYGQFIGGVLRGRALVAGEAGHLVQLSQSATQASGFRTNIGFVNTTASPIMIVVALYRADGTYLGTRTYSLPAYGYRQVDRVFQEVTSADVPEGRAAVTTTTQGGGFFAYASVIDNRSGDPIYIPARKEGG